MAKRVWAVVRILGRSVRGSRMTDHSPSGNTQLGLVILKAVAERETPSETLADCAKAIETTLEMADRQGIRDEALDAQARQTLIHAMQRMGARRRWRLPRKSKQHATELPTQQMSLALGPASTGSD